MQNPQYQPVPAYNPAAYQANVPPPQTGAPKWWQNMIKAAKKVEQDAMRARSYGPQVQSAGVLPYGYYQQAASSPQAQAAYNAAYGYGPNNLPPVQPNTGLVNAIGGSNTPQNWENYVKPAPQPWNFNIAQAGPPSPYTAAVPVGSSWNLAPAGPPSPYTAPAPAPSTGYGGGGGGYGGYGGYPSYPSYSAPTPGVDRWLYGILNWRIGTGV
jgi:hypothetical protein